MLVDLTAASAYMKQRFIDKRLANMSYEGAPLFGMLPKKTDFGGENLKVPVSYSDLRGRSAQFSVAQANKAGSATKAFLITTVEDYSVFGITGKQIKQSQGNMNAWLPTLEKEAESAARSLARSTSWAVFRDPVGGIATINSTVTGTTLTLSSRADIQNFEEGMKVYFADPSSPYTLRDSGETVEVTAINRDTGAMTVSPSLSTISGLTASDLIIPEGDRNARISGLSAWIPTSVTSSTFFNVDRTSDATRLGGIRYDATGQNILEAVIGAATRAGENGARPSHLFVNYDLYRQLINYVGSQSNYQRVVGNAQSAGGQKADVGYNGFRFHVPGSEIEVYADRHCQPNTGWLLQMDTWCLHSSGSVPMLLEEDGQTILRESTADGYEGRWGLYAQLYCTAPGYNVRISNL